MGRRAENVVDTSALTWKCWWTAVRRKRKRVAVSIAVMSRQTQRSWGLIVAVVMVELSCVEHLEPVTSRRIPTRRYVGEDLLSKC